MLLRSLSICLLLAAAGGCSRERTSVAVDAALLTQVPPDSIAVGALRVKALRDTAAWKLLLQQPSVNAAFDRMAKETSFDPRKDLWELLWSTDGKETLVYARGEFAPMGLEPKIEGEGIQRLNYKGAMLLGNEEQAVWFVNSSTGIFGDTTRLRALIDARDAKQAGPSQAIRDKINALPPNTHIWLVADAAALPNPDRLTGDKKGKDSPASGMAANFLANLPKLLSTVKMVTVQTTLVDGIAMDMTAFCDGEPGAKQVHDSLRGIVGLARIVLPARERAAMMPLLDSIEVTQKQSDATLRARLTVEQFENLHASLTRKSGGAKAAD